MLIRLNETYLAQLAIPEMKAKVKKLKTFVIDFPLKMKIKNASMTDIPSKEMILMY